MKPPEQRNEDRADSVRAQQQDADDREAERRAKIPTPRTDAYYRGKIMPNARTAEFAMELERDLVDIHQTHIYRPIAQSIVRQALRSMVDPGAFTPRVHDGGHNEPLHQWQKRALQLVLAKLEVADLPLVRDERMEPLP